MVCIIRKCLGDYEYLYMLGVGGSHRVDWHQGKVCVWCKQRPKQWTPEWPPSDQWWSSVYPAPKHSITRGSSFLKRNHEKKIFQHGYVRTFTTSGWKIVNPTFPTEGNSFEKGLLKFNRNVYVDHHTSGVFPVLEYIIQSSKYLSVEYCFCFSILVFLFFLFFLPKSQQVK
jgi:hypothetical protein